MILKKDNLRLGLLLGLLGPLLGLLIIWQLKANAISFTEFLEEYLSNNRQITAIGSLSLLANAVLFTIYINTDRDETAKGIFATTVIYGIGILILKLFN
ncbi:MAG: hypothetical protein ACKO6Q_06680 [Bacteroidota bacterium]